MTCKVLVGSMLDPSRVEKNMIHIYSNTIKYICSENCEKIITPLDSAKTNKFDFLLILLLSLVVDKLAFWCLNNQKYEIQHTNLTSSSVS